MKIQKQKLISTIIHRDFRLEYSTKVTPMIRVKDTILRLSITIKKLYI